MAYEKYTVGEFKSAWFDDDRTVIKTNEEFDLVYNEYIDTAGLFEEDEFERVSYIYYINGRINSIKIGIRLQKEFINNFDIPYLGKDGKGLEFFKKFGYIVYWKNDVQQFLYQLDKIESKEKKYLSILDNKLKELTDFRAKKNSKEKPDKSSKKNSRHNFIRIINSLGKVGYKIDEDKTKVEDLALMIRQQNEDNKRQ